MDALEVKDPNKVGYITQTTLSLDETRDIIARLKERYPHIEGPAAQDICYATENRQVAVKAVAPLCWAASSALARWLAYSASWCNLR